MNNDDEVTTSSDHSRLLREAWRAGHWSNVERLARRMLDIDEGAMNALLALALLHTEEDPDETHLAWRNVERIARRSGEQHIAEVAAHTAQGLELPLPPALPGVPRRRWLSEAAHALADCGFDIEDTSDPVDEGPGTPPPPDFDISDSRGGRWALLYISTRFEPHVVHNTLVRIAALRANRVRADARVAVVSPFHQPWLVRLLASDCTDARFLLELESLVDPSMTVLDETIDHFMRCNRNYYGESLDGSLMSLIGIDRLLRRLHTHGFGAATWALACHVAAYASSVLRAWIPESEWVTRNDGAKLFAVSDAASLDLHQLTEAALADGGPACFTRQLEQVLGPLPIPPSPEGAA